MTKINDKINGLKQRFDDPNVPLKEKVEIIEFFKEYNDIFYGNIDIDSFYKQLTDLTDKEQGNE